MPSAIREACVCAKRPGLSWRRTRRSGGGRPGRSVEDRRCRRPATRRRSARARRRARTRRPSRVIEARGPCASSARSPSSNRDAQVRRGLVQRGVSDVCPRASDDQPSLVDDERGARAEAVDVPREQAIPTHRAQHLGRPRYVHDPELRRARLFGRRDLATRLETDVAPSWRQALAVGLALGPHRTGARRSQARRDRARFAQVIGVVAAAALHRSPPWCSVVRSALRARSRAARSGGTRGTGSRRGTRWGARSHSPPRTRPRAG